MPAPKPVVLCILDGWGIGPNPETSAPAQAHVPTFNHLWASCPHATLTTFGPDVGLPTGQMGNSEVGHTNIGAGRIVAMDLGAIDLAVEDGSFAKNPAILDFAAKVKATGGTAHLMGVVSDGGVHGHVNHVLAACRAITALGVPVALHAVTDGRDVAPSSALNYVTQLVQHLPYGASIATVTGRYWAMDRDNRWERVSRAFDAMVHARGETAPDPLTAVSNSYGKGETDEFLAPTVIDGYHGARDGDGIFCLNFRADRAREILAAIGAPDFAAFDTGVRPKWCSLLGMVEYSDLHNAYIGTAFPKRVLVNTLGEWVASHGLTQFRLAETEKYPHVTYFLNGGRELPYEGEERIMVPSPKVATYDLAPEMSAFELTEKAVEVINAGRHDLIVLNFANPDMVGHTGSLPAAIAAVEAVDTCLGLIMDAIAARKGALLVIADHGNCEVMRDPETGEPHTAHTTNMVPVILMGAKAAKLRTGRLADVAPTLLELLGVELPAEMDGRSLIQR